MTSIEKVNEDIITRVKTAFPSVSFIAPEKFEEITRPSFKVIIDEIKSERNAAGYAKRIYPVQLVYFAVEKSRPKNECLAIYDRLEPALYSITNKIAAGIDYADAVLVTEFEIEDYVGLSAPSDDTGEDIENLELMEELN